MKGSLGLLAVLCVSVSLTGALRIWEDGKEYVFREESAIHVGTKDHANVASGFRLMSEVKVQVSGEKLVVAINKVEEAHFNQMYNRGGWPYRLVQEKDLHSQSKYIPSAGYENGHTFSITMKDGLMDKLELPEDLSLNGKNMMRALASILQVDTTGHEMGMWTKRERSMHGECDFDYTFLRDDHLETREISKTVSHMKDCRKRNFRLFDNSNSKTCNVLRHDGDKHVEDLMDVDDIHSKLYEPLRRDVTDGLYHTEPIHSTSMTTYLMKELEPEKMEIQKIFSAGAVIVQKFTEKGPTHVTLANRTLTLLEVRGVSNLETVPNPVEFEDLEYHWMEDKPLWNDPITLDDLKMKESFFHNGFTFDEPQAELVEILKTEIKEYVEEMDHYRDPVKNKEEAVKKLHEHGVHKLLPYFHSLDYNSIMTLKDFYMDQMVTSRDVFFELLPIAGTWPAALAIRDIVMNDDCKSDIDTARLLTSIPFHVEPVKALVEEYFKLVTSDKPHLKYPLTRSALELSYAHMVRRTCHDLTTQEECFKAFHIEHFIKRFEEFAIDDFANLQHMMLFFYNFRDSQLLEDKLKAILFNKTPKRYDQALRTQAVFALSYRAIRKGIEKEIFLPIFLNRNEHHEVRIAAFDTLMRGTPTTTTLNKIMTYMIYEDDYEVFNYVYTAFDKFATHHNEPCGRMIHDYAKYFIKYWKQHMWQKPKYIFGVSKAYSNSFTQDKYGYSGSIEVHTVGSHRTASPMSMMIDVRTQRFNHLTMQNFGVFIRMEGVAERLVDKIMEITRTKVFKFDSLKEILFTGMNIREHKHVPAKLCFILLLRDNVVFEIHFKDNEMHKTLDTILPLLTQMRSWKDIRSIFRSHFGLDWTTFVYEQPTEFGVPMAFVDGAISMLGVEGGLGKDMDWNGELDFKIRMNTVKYDLMTFVHPDEKTLFSITKEVVHNLRIESMMTASFDFNTRKLWVAMKVPETARPIAKTSHAHTFVSTIVNKFGGKQLYLEKSCATCRPMVVVTRGTEHKRRGALIKEGLHELGHVYGVEMTGRIFDCEIPEAFTQGQRLLGLMDSFNPMSKEPKSIFNILVSGLRRLNAFLVDFPRAESCGLDLMLSRAMIDPVDEVIFDFDLTQLIKESHKTKFIDGKRIFLAGDITFHGLVNRTHHIEMEMDIAPMWTKTKFDLEIRRRSFMLQSKQYQEFPIHFHMETRSEEFKFPLRLKDLTSIARHELKTNIKLTWGKHDAKIHVEGNHKTTAEAMDHLRSKWYYTTCMKEKELPEWMHTDNLPMTDACMYAFHDLYTLRHYTWDIMTTQLEPWMVSAYKKAGTLIKTAFFPFWEFRPETSMHEKATRQPRIHIDQIYNSRKNNIDLILKVDNDVSKFIGINYGFMRWNEEPYLSLSKLNLMARATMPPQLLTTFFYNNILNHCVATSHSIYTYDNVTYPYTVDHDCWKLISSDCSEHPAFAVFMKKEEKTPLGLLTYIGNDKVEIIPVEKDKFKMMINGQEMDIKRDDFLFYKPGQPLVINKPLQNYIFKIILKKNTFLLDFFPHMMLQYDGHHVQVLAGPLSKGRNCGMCSDYNRNGRHELMDPQMCHLDNGDQMALAWTMDKKFCDKQIEKPVCTRTEPFI